MVGVEDHCAVLDCVVGVCVVCADDIEAEIRNYSPRRHGDTEKGKKIGAIYGRDWRCT
jgi:hypothetical protein